VGFAVWTDRCSFPVEARLAAKDDPALVMTGACTFIGDLNTTVELFFESDITADPTITGNVTVVYPAMPTDTRAWSGTFTGADSMAGSFSGS